MVSKTLPHSYQIPKTLAKAGSYICHALAVVTVGNGVPWLAPPSTGQQHVQHMRGTAACVWSPSEGVSRGQARDPVRSVLAERLATAWAVWRHTWPAGSLIRWLQRLASCAVLALSMTSVHAHAGCPVRCLRSSAP